MAGERWRELLPRLRAGDDDAWAVIVNEHYGVVFAGMLEQARRRNSHYHGPLADPDVQELAQMLTDDAFATAKHRISRFDDRSSALPTWIRWQGMSISKGVIDPLIRQERDRAGQRDLDVPTPPRVRSPSGPEAAAIAREEQAELRRRFDGILRAMRPEWSAAIILLNHVLNEGHPSPIRAAAQRSGRSYDAMTSLLRRASEDFRSRWRAEYGEYPAATGG